MTLTKKELGKRILIAIIVILTVSFVIEVIIIKKISTYEVVKTMIDSFYNSPESPIPPIIK